MVKAKASEDLVVKLLSVEIVRIIVVLSFESSRVFLQNGQRAGTPGLGPYWGRRDVRAATSRWAVGPGGVVAGPFLFF